MEEEVPLLLKALNLFHRFLNSWNMGRGVAGGRRRNVLRFLAGLGLGAAVAEVYERLYSIPSLERRFREEVGYWVGRYNSAKAELDNLAAQYNAAERRIEDLAAQQSSAEKKIEDLTLQVRGLDGLEMESDLAISFYQQQLDEAIKGLRNTVEKYRSILGEERVAFESSTLKVLEDLKVTREELRATNEKLLKLLPYFPLIKDLSWNPSKVVNDKVYSLNVSFEVISPLNTLKEVEVKLIPVQYSHLPREAFPQEEVKTVKLQPKRLEREMFSVDFDLKGGREYTIETVAKDVAGSFNTNKTKTPYIREFENLGEVLYDKGIIVGAVYYSLYPDPHPWEALEPMFVHPLLGKYDVRDPIAIARDIDWLTGHGVNCLFYNWGIWYSVTEKIHRNILTTTLHPLFNDIYFSISYETPERLNAAGVYRDPYGFFHVKSVDNLTVIEKDFEMIKELVEKPNFLRIDEKPVIDLYETKGIRGDVEHFINSIKNGIGKQVFLFSDHATPVALPPYKEFLEMAKLYDGWTLWAGGYFRDREYSLEYLENGLKGWRELAEENSKYFMPSFIPGFVDLRIPCIPYYRDPEDFGEAAQLALRYSFTPISSRYKRIIRIDTANEYGEGTAIGPTQEEKFAFLEKLRTTLLNYIFHKD